MKITFKAIVPRSCRLRGWWCCFSVTGAGRVGEGGGGLECRFSLALPLEVVDGTEEVLDDVEETDRLVLRRSRILNKADLMKRLRGTSSWSRFPYCARE